MQNFLSKRASIISPYTAGAQPQAKSIVKLNTNENPYPPSPAAIEAYRSFDASRLRLYPHPEGGELRTAAAALSSLPESHVFCGNGSDEILGFAFLAFFDGDIVFPDITYSFYPVWAALYDISYTLLPVKNDFTIPVNELRAQGGIVLANPNAPTGIALLLSDIETVLKNNAHCLVIVDEAYVAFGAQSADVLVRDYPNLLVVHTLSKSHALAGLRVAYAYGQPHLTQGLTRIKDCFNRTRSTRRRSTWPQPRFGILPTMPTSHAKSWIRANAWRSAWLQWALTCCHPPQTSFLLPKKARMHHA